MVRSWVRLSHEVLEFGASEQSTLKPGSQYNVTVTLQKSCSVMIVVCSVLILNILRHSTVMHLVGLKPGSQYNVNVTLLQEVIQFLMGLSQRQSLE